jgi:predicted transposase/invertase (TIGR01784 family)
LKNKDIINNPLHRWLTFLDKSADDETLNTILEMDTAIKKAHDVIKHVLQDKEMLHAYHMHEMAIMDYNSGVYAAEQRKITEVVINMKLFGLSIEDIAKIADVTKEKVIQILKEQGISIT